MFRITYQETNLYLPNPLFGEGYELGHDVILHETVAQTVRTVVLRKPKQYRMSFEITTEKAFELESFIATHRAHKVKVAYDLFSVEGYFENDPIDLVAQGRWSPCREKITIELRVNEASN